jgi:hypothetical protein
LPATSPLAATKKKGCVVEESNGEKLWNWGWNAPKIGRDFMRMLVIIPKYGREEPVRYPPDTAYTAPPLGECQK